MGYGDGTIVQEPSGRYRGARIIKGKRVYVRGNTKTEVREKLRAREQAAAAGLKANPRMTVGEVLEAWLAEASPKRARVNSANTIQNHRWAVEKHLVPNLGKVLLTELTREDVEAVFKDLARGSRSTTSAIGLGRDTLVRSFEPHSTWRSTGPAGSSGSDGTPQWASRSPRPLRHLRSASRYRSTRSSDCSSPLRTTRCTAQSG